MLKKCLSAFIFLVILSALPFQSSAAAPKAKLIVLPIVNSSQVLDDWVVEHLDATLKERFPAKDYEYINTEEVASILRDNGYVSGFGTLPDKTTAVKLARRFNADGFVALDITRILYSTTNSKITELTGKEQVFVFMDAHIYNAKKNTYLEHSSRKNIEKKLGPFTPFERETTITAGLDLCLGDILTKVDF